MDFTEYSKNCYQILDEDIDFELWLEPTCNNTWNVGSTLWRRPRKINVPHSDFAQAQKCAIAMATARIYSIKRLLEN